MHQATPSGFDKEKVNMEEKVMNILEEVNEELFTYTGSNMLDDGLVNSLTFISMVSELEDAFNIELDSSLLEEEYFGNKDRIIKTIKELLA